MTQEKSTNGTEDTSAKSRKNDTNKMKMLGGYEQTMGDPHVQPKSMPSRLAGSTAKHTYVCGHIQYGL